MSIAAPHHSIFNQISSKQIKKSPYTSCFSAYEQGVTPPSNKKDKTKNKNIIKICEIIIICRHFDEFIIKIIERDIFLYQSANEYSS